MSATITAPYVTTGSGLSPVGFVRSEWIKLRSVRSTIWSFAIVIAVSLGMAFLLSSTLSAQEFGPLLDSPERTLVQAATFGASFGALVVAVLGVLVISGEYSTGMVRSTFTAVPTRLPALAAKALVLFVATFVVGLVSAAGSALVALPVLAGNGVEPQLTGDVVLSLVLSAVYLGFVALFALGLGTILRSSAGGIAGALGVLLLLPTILLTIGGITQAAWVADVMPYLLVSAGEGMYLPSAGGFEQWQSTLIAAGWAIASLVIGAVILKRRDA